MNDFEQREADTVLLFRRSAQVDLLWNPEASATTKQARTVILFSVLLLCCGLQLQSSWETRPHMPIDHRIGS